MFWMWTFNAIAYSMAADWDVQESIKKRRAREEEEERNQAGLTPQACRPRAAKKKRRNMKLNDAIKIIQDYGPATVTNQGNNRWQIALGRSLPLIVVVDTQALILTAQDLQQQTSWEKFCEEE